MNTQSLNAMNFNKAPSRLTQLLCAVFMLLALCVGSLATQNTHAAEKTIHFYNDIAGSPQMAVDADSGQVLWKENYRPFGERINNSPASASGKGDNDLYFHGKQAEPLNGGVTIQYFGARYFMSGHSDRFMSTDPVHFTESNVHSFNRFAYGNNNPYKFRDPDGRTPESPLMDTVVGDPQSVAVFHGMMHFGNALTMVVPAAQLVRGGIAMYRGIRGAEAAAAAGEVASGTAVNSEVTVYRVFGGDARAQGFSWTTKDPRTISNFRDAAGLPSGGQSGATNTADFLVAGRANAENVIKSRPALPLDGNKGGLPELIIDPKNVKITDFAIMKP